MQLKIELKYSNRQEYNPNRGNPKDQSNVVLNNTNIVDTIAKAGGT
jgi:hypothetical protein